MPDREYISCHESILSVTSWSSSSGLIDSGECQRDYILDFERINVSLPLVAAFGLLWRMLAGLHASNALGRGFESRQPRQQLRL